jgi:Domain of unknown function (DUF4288)
LCTLARIREEGLIILRKFKWFAVAILYESVHEGQPTFVDENYDTSTKTYEESHLLIKANTSEEAICLGEKLGYENEHSYENKYGENVHQKFIKVLECFELIDENLKTGTEVYSRHILVAKENSTQDVLKRFFQE